MFFFYFLVVVEHRQDQGGTWVSSDPISKPIDYKKN